MSKPAAITATEFSTTTGSIYYEILEPQAVDAAPILTLLHNFMSTGRSAWGPLLEKLSKRFRILLPDLPGHGRSIGYPEAFHFGEMAEQLGALLVKENATDGHLAGCSAGGMIAQLLLAQGIVEPKTLTLISTTYSVNPAVTENVQELKPERFRFGRRWMEATAKLHDPYHHAGYYEEILLANFRQSTPATAIDLPLTTLQEWQLPICLIHGVEDEFFPVSAVQQMADVLPYATLHLIPEQPHALLFRQPWKVLALMDDFLP